MRTLLAGTARILPLLLVAVLVSGSPVAQSETPEETPEETTDARPKRGPRDLPPDSGVEERVEVELAEFTVLVTDKRGNAIPDLRLDEIKVFEEGVEQRLAFIDSVAAGRISFERKVQEQPTAELFSAAGDRSSDASEIVVIPPKERRRVVFVFDVKNSKKNVRDEWKESALEWLDGHLEPGDWVGLVLLQSYPQWLVGFTDDRDVLRNGLEAVSLERSAANRDRSREVTDLVQQITNLCVDPRGADHRAGERNAPRASYMDNERGCAYNLVEIFVQEWHTESEDTLGALRSLTGQLAAIPGRKAILLFSEGILADATMAGVNTMKSVLGNVAVDVSDLSWRLNRTSWNSIEELHKTARAGDVSFFTLNTNRYQETGFDGQLESGQALAYSATGVNPWSEVRWDSQGTLQALAKETGGRSYRGVKKLPENVAAAAAGFYGLYKVGYYRADPRRPMGKVSIEVDRKKLKIDYPERPGLWPHRADLVKMDLSVGAPHPSVEEPGRQAVPLALTIPFDRLPLRRGHAGRGLQMGVFLEAVRPDGSVAAQKLEVAAIVADREQRHEARGKMYRHETDLALEPGSYRIRARFSDDRQEIISDVSVDLTVTPSGGVEPGLRAENAPSD